MFGIIVGFDSVVPMVSRFMLATKLLFPLTTSKCFPTPKFKIVLISSDKHGQLSNGVQIRLGFIFVGSLLPVILLTSKDTTTCIKTDILDIHK